MQLIRRFRPERPDRLQRSAPHLVLVSPNHPRIAVLVTPWPKLCGRRRLSRARQSEIARLRLFLGPYLLILRGAAWIDPTLISPPKSETSLTSVRACAVPASSFESRLEIDDPTETIDPSPGYAKPPLCEPPRLLPSGPVTETA